MKNLNIFVERLKKIGIHVELIGNYPWIYLDKVNGIKVEGKFEGNHGFTCWWLPVNRNRPDAISDITEVFKKIRETLNKENL